MHNRLNRLDTTKTDSALNLNVGRNFFILFKFRSQNQIQVVYASVIVAAWSTSWDMIWLILCKLWIDFNESLQGEVLNTLHLGCVLCIIIIYITKMYSGAPNKPVGILFGFRFCLLVLSLKWSNQNIKNEYVLRMINLIIV